MKPLKHNLSPPANALTKRAKLVKEAREHLKHKRSMDALQLIKGAPAKLRNDPEILFLRAKAYEDIGQLKLAIESAKLSLKKMEHPDPIFILIRCNQLLGETDQTLEWCDRAEKIAPGYEPIQCQRGSALEAAGRAEEAAAVLEPLIAKAEREGKPPSAWLRVEWSKALVQLKRFDEALTIIDSTLEPGEMVDQGRCVQFYLKAKAHDRKKEYDNSFEAAEQANAIGFVEFDPDLYEEQVSMLMDIWSAKDMKKFPIADCDSELPVFIAGMPRSGTSLIDQIIDAHPLAAGVGELDSIETFAMKLSKAYDPEIDPPGCFGEFDEHQWTRVAREYVQKLAKLSPQGSQRVVNKALGNNKLIGLIARLFPKTRVIHAMRDPRDVAISCFMGGFNNRLHPWTTRIEWAANAWAQSERMMQHWKDTLDIPIMEVHYERLVADPEHEFPRLIEFLGLDWDERCNDFYKSKRTVRTLSYDQVNRPIYRSSSGRHVNYAKHIEGVEFPAYDTGMTE